MKIFSERHGLKKVRTEIQVDSIVGGKIDDAYAELRKQQMIYLIFMVLAAICLIVAGFLLCPSENHTGCLIVILVGLMFVACVWLVMFKILKARWKLEQAFGE